MLLLVHVAMCLKKCFPRGQVSFSVSTNLFAASRMFSLCSVHIVDPLCQGMGRTLMANAFIIGAIIPAVEFLQDLGA